MILVPLKHNELPQFGYVRCMFEGVYKKPGMRQRSRCSEVLRVYPIVWYFMKSLDNSKGLLSALSGEYGLLGPWCRPRGHGTRYEGVR